MIMHNEKTDIISFVYVCATFYLGFFCSCCSLDRRPSIARDRLPTGTRRLPSSPIGYQLVPRDRLSR